MRFDRRKWSLCSECPLNGQRKVWSECDLDHPKIVTIGEGPGEEEDRTGRPFAGPAGSILTKLTVTAAIMRRNMWVTNVVSCRPPRNDLGSSDGQEAIRCCRPGFLAEMAHLKRSARVFIPLGNYAMEALGLEPKITKRRGFVHDLREKNIKGDSMVAVPTFHPSYIMRGNWKESGIVVQDLRKVWDIVSEGWTAPEENFNLSPTLGDLEVVRDRSKKDDLLIGVDIETTGLRPRRGSIVVVGLALSGTEAISFPVLCQGGASYWDGGWTKASRLLQEILNRRTIFQNATFDIPHLEINGWKIPRLEHDTILLHHAIHPELRHRLDFIVSLYGTTPYWKGEFLGREGSILSMANEELRTYNLRDSVVLHQVLEPLLEDLHLAGTERTYYDVSMRLVRPVMDMTREGLLVDQDFLRKWKATLKRREKDFLQKFHGVLGLPVSLNLRSGEHLDLLFHGDKPAKQFLRAVEEYESYDQPVGKDKRGKDKKLRRKDTKVYRELTAKVEAFRGAPSMVMPSAWKPRKTDGGDYSYDDDAILWMKNTCLNRLEEMRTFIHQDGRIERERVGLLRTIDFLSTFQKYTKNGKLISTYSEFPIWPDGRIHPNFKIYGTATGRLSSGEERKSKTDSEKFNAQNIPPEARKLIIAPEGYDFMKADYSGFEPAILAYICGDEKVIEAYERGISPHDPNTEDFFGVTKADPKWKTYRQAQKVWVLRRAYGGGLRGAYEGIMQDVEDLDMSYSQFCENDRRYREKHPAYTKWYEETSRRLRTMESPQIRNQFGRLRILLGTRDEVVRAGLDHDMQSTAADIINDAMIRIRDELAKGKMKSRIVNQVHDELDFYRHKSERKSLVQIVMKNMRREYKIGGRKARFQVELSCGPSWGDQKVFNPSKP